MGHHLLHDLQHHASDKYEVAAALALSFASILNPAGWQVVHAGEGNNSWRLYHPERKETWFLTGYGKGEIIARNQWRWAQSNKRFTMRTRLDTVRFANWVRAGAPSAGASLVKAKVKP